MKIWLGFLLLIVSICKAGDDFTLSDADRDRYRCYYGEKNLHDDLISCLAHCIECRQEMNADWKKHLAFLVEQPGSDINQCLNSKNENVLHDRWKIMDILSSQDSFENSEEQKLVKFLVEKARIDINAVNNAGNTPLFYACKSLSMVTYLYRLGADIHHCNASGENLCYRARGEVLEWLIKQGVNADKLNINDETPLLIATSRCDIETMKILLDHGYRLKAQHIVLILMQFKDIVASPHVKPFIVRVQQRVQQAESLKLLNKYHNRNNENLLFVFLRASNILSFLGFTKDQKLAITKFLIEQVSIDVNAVSTLDGKTPVFYARDVEILAYLHDRGASIHHCDANNQNLCHWASQDVVSWLLEQGVDIGLVDRHGESPLFKAASWLEVEKVDLLLRSGQRLNKVQLQDLLKKVSQGIEQKSDTTSQRKTLLSLLLYYHRPISSL